MKWDSLTGSARFVATKFLKEKGLELASTPITVVSENGSVIATTSPRKKTTLQLFVRLVVTVSNSTTYLVTAEISGQTKGWKLVPNTLTAVEVPTPAAAAKVTAEPLTAARQKVEDWYHY